MTTTEELRLLRLLQLASPNLPIGAYAYSQGLEWAVEAGWVVDEESFFAWIKDQLTHAISFVDLPVVQRLHAAAADAKDNEISYWSDWLLCSRESSELRADDTDRAYALVRLLDGLKVQIPLPATDAMPYATPFSLISQKWGIGVRDAMRVYAWGWLENQIVAGIKLIPLGQVAGQRLMSALLHEVVAACDKARELDDDDLGGGLPSLSIASALHETQYTRLFRS